MILPSHTRSGSASSSRRSPAPQIEHYIGLMSGTSIDGVDAALVSFQQDTLTLLASHCHPYPAQLQQALHTLCHSGHAEIERLADVEETLTRTFAQACGVLLQQANVQAETITAIGCHGQTIRHHPEQRYTLQIGDAHLLAVLTGIDTVADFRRKDMALGGQGAPLVPAFHQAIFADPNQIRVILNIGGIANITVLDPAAADVIGFDTGPGNTLLDQWYQQHNSTRASGWDNGGAWAASGRVIPTLLAKLEAHPFLTQPFPKSTGREAFNLPWLEGQLATWVTQEHASSLPAAADIQRTLLQLTVNSIAKPIYQLLTSGEVVVCGGGVHNATLMAALAEALPEFAVLPSEQRGLHADWVEAVAFAWLARCFMHGQPGNLCQVTGAARPAVLGALYPAR